VAFSNQEESSMPHLIDVVFTCGLTAVVAAVAIPSMHLSREHDQARAAARFVAARLQTVRLEALRRNTVVAMRFDPADEGRFGIYVDGDGDGVLQRDIDRGIDFALQPVARLSDYFAVVSFRIATNVPGPDGSGPLVAGSDPIRLGATNLMSFSPLGSATSGTVYLAGRGGPQMAIRVLGATGRMRVLWFDRTTAAWRDD
jgi:hypothetical protein